MNRKVSSKNPLLFIYNTVSNHYKMKIFLSSTCYDLKDLRAEVEKFLSEKGHELLLSDRATFPIDPEVHRHDVCLQNVHNADLFILALDGRFGAKYYKNEDISITWAEFREALKTGKSIIPFVRREVFNERQSCRHNQKKGNEYDPAFADNIKTFDFIDEIQQHEGGYWMEIFDNSVQVKTRLENIYETNHSSLNYEPLTLSGPTDEVPLSMVSGSTASYITNYINEEPTDNLSLEILDKAIDSIPNETAVWGEILGFENIPGANDYFYFRPIKQSGDEGEIIVGISPTALGKSVRDELKDLKDKMKKK